MTSPRSSSAGLPGAAGRADRARGCAKKYPRYAQYRDSGVEWLGQVPTHWKRKRLRYLFHMTGGMTPEKAEPRFWDGNIPWVTPKDMKVDVISDSEDHVTAAAIDEIRLSMVPSGAVLLVVRGMILAHSIPIALTAAPVTINQDMKALIATSEVRSDYLAWMLRGMKSLLLTMIEESGHGTKAFRTDVLRSIEVLLPPLNEQRTIAELLDRETARIDALIEKSGRPIAVDTSKPTTMVGLLMEYRSSLIAAAVTGQIDLRNAA